MSSERPLLAWWRVAPACCVVDQVIAELQANMKASMKANGPTADAVAFGTCEKTSFAKEMVKASTEFFHQLSGRSVELGVAGCSSTE
jgi:tRNA A37 methylthiotransferase MiaB